MRRRLKYREAVVLEHAPAWLSEEGEQLADEIGLYLVAVDEYRALGADPFPSPAVERVAPYLTDCDPGDEDDGWRREAA